MFIIFGSRGFKIRLGTTLLHRTCGHCHNDVRLDAYKTGSKFTLFFIPIFPISSKYHVICPICQYGFEVSKQEMNELLIQDE